jgi:hypothetical protein
MDYRIVVCTAQRQCNLQWLWTFGGSARLDFDHARIPEESEKLQHFVWISNLGEGTI